MTLEEFIQWAQTNMADWISFPTLGYRSHFEAKYYDEQRVLLIRNSRKRELKIKYNQLQEIFGRFYTAPPNKKYISYYYQIQSWRAPDKIATPAVPAIFRRWLGEEGKWRIT